MDIQINNILAEAVKQIYNNLPKTIEENNKQITAQVLNRISNQNTMIYKTLLESYRTNIIDDFKNKIQPKIENIFKETIEGALKEIVSTSKKEGELKVTGGGKKLPKKPRKTRKLRKSTL